MYIPSYHYAKAFNSFLEIVIIFSAYDAHFPFVAAPLHIYLQQKLERAKSKL